MSKIERVLRATIIELKAENIRLRKLRAEDREFAEKRLGLEIKKAVDGADKSCEVLSLEQQIIELQATIEEEGAMIDNICVYLRKRNSEGD